MDHYINIGCVSEYINEVLKIADGWYSVLYRGQANCSWELESSAYRAIAQTNHSLMENPISKHHILEHHKRMLSEVKLLRDSKEELSDFHQIAHLQHHGAPTALIDYTRNPLVALWFACQTSYDKCNDRGCNGTDCNGTQCNRKECNGAIYIFKYPMQNIPLIQKDSSLEELFKSPKESADIDLNMDEQKTKSSIKPSNSNIIDNIESQTFIFNPPHINSRIPAQDSVFILNITGKLSKQEHHHVIIESKNKGKILKELSMLGISQKTLFPDFSGFSLWFKPIYTSVEYYEQLIVQATSLINDNNYIEALSKCNEALTFANDYFDSNDIKRVLVYNRKARIHTLQKDMSKALECLYESEKIFINTPKQNSDEAARTYVEFVRYYLEEGALVKAQEYLNKIDSIYNNTNEPEKQNIALIYAITLINLSSKQKEDAILTTITSIKSLHNKHPQNETITEIYAIGLANLSTEQGLENVIKTVESLNFVYKNFPQNEHIAYAYAIGLVNISVEQDLDNATKTIDTIKSLHEKHPDNEEICRIYAMGLANLSPEQNIDNATQTIDTIKSLHEKHPQNEHIAYAYARGLVTLSAQQDLDNATQTIDTIKTLHEKHPENEEICRIYALGLANLSPEQDIDNAPKTIDTIKSVYEKHPENEDIAYAYARGLVTLSAQQGLDNATKTIDTIKSIYEKHPENQDISRAYAMGLANLSAEQDLDNATKTIDTIKSVYEKHPENEDFSRAYAMGLANLSSDQNLDNATKTIDTIKSLHEKHPQNEHIAYAYARGLVTLSAQQDLDNATKTIDSIKTLHEKHPENEDISRAYAMGLVNLSTEQDLDNATKTIDSIKTLHEKYPENEDISRDYAMGLANLSTEQDLDNATKTIDIIKTLHKKHPENEDVSRDYAMGLVNLSTEQDLDNATKTIDIIKTLHKKHPENEDVSYHYAVGLSHLGYEHYKNNDLALAEKHFILAYTLLPSIAGTNLAYMKRRGETTDACTMSIPELLKSGLDANNSLAKVNCHLQMATGKEEVHDWQAADKGFASFTQEEANKVIDDWWGDLYNKCDPEGLLVLTWFRIHDLYPGEIDEGTYESLKSSYCDLPEWFSKQSITV